MLERLLQLGSMFPVFRDDAAPTASQQPVRFGVFAGEDYEARASGSKPIERGSPDSHRRWIAILGRDAPEPCCGAGSQGPLPRHTRVPSDEVDQVSEEHINIRSARLWATRVFNEDGRDHGRTARGIWHIELALYPHSCNPCHPENIDDGVRDAVSYEFPNVRRLQISKGLPHFRREGSRVH